MTISNLFALCWSVFRETLKPPAPTWSADDIPDMTGKVAIVTGGYAGLGKETVKELLKHNARVYIAGRSETKAKQAIDELRSVTGGKEALFLYLDLASFNSVRNAATKFQSLESQLHVLVNNGGAVQPDISETTEDGYDLQFGTNVIGHYLFTKLLMPTLIATAKSTSGGGEVRIVNVASIAEGLCSHIDYATLKDGPVRRKQDTSMMYCQSKAAIVLLSVELANRYAADGIISIAIHPGLSYTYLPRNAYRWRIWLWKRMVYGPELGAVTQIYAATAINLKTESLNGKYLVPWARIGQPFGRAAQNPVEGEKLWEWLEEQTRDP